MFINTISESKSKIYSECHLKYKYRYINRYEEEAGNADALHFGSYIHRILELGVDASGVGHASGLIGCTGTVQACQVDGETQHAGKVAPHEVFHIDR